jgi:hypothetical protein
MNHDPLARQVRNVANRVNKTPLNRKDEAMRRVLLTLATMGILAVAASPALADHGYHHGYRHGGFYAPAYVQPRVWVAPPVVAPYVGYPVVVPPPVYRYRPYYPGVQSGFYYRGPGVSIGVGF